MRSPTLNIPSGRGVMMNESRCFSLDIHLPPLATGIGGLLI
jgi:hypothetical protein